MKSILGGLALLPTLLPAQAEKDYPDPRETKWQRLVEAHIGSQQTPAVAGLLELLRGYWQACTEDGGGDHDTAKLFLTPETIAALPIHARIYAPPGKQFDALMHFDHASPVDWGKAFANQRIQSIDAERQLWQVQRMWLRVLPLGNGRQRMIFGDALPKGEDAPKHPLLNSIYEVKAGRPILPRAAMAQLRAAPIWMTMNVAVISGSRRQMSAAQAIISPRLQQLGFAANVLGKSPVLDVFTGMRPGDGMIGGLLSRKPRNAAPVGKLGFTADLLLHVDLGKDFPRSLRTLTKAMMADGFGKRLDEVVSPLLEDWDGRLSLRLSGDPAAEPIDDRSNLPKLIEHGLFPSLRGSLCLSVDAEGSTELKRGIDGLLALMPSRGKDTAEPQPGEPRTFALEKGLHLHVAAQGSILSFGLGRKPAEAVAMARAPLAAEDSNPPPARLRMLRGPIKLHASKNAMRYLFALTRRSVRDMMRRTGESQIDFVLGRLDKTVCAKPLDACLSWSRQLGTWLRLWF